MKIDYNRINRWMYLIVAIMLTGISFNYDDILDKIIIFTCILCCLMFSYLCRNMSETEEKDDDTLDG